MKKILRFLSFIGVIVLMGYFLIQNLNKQDSEVVVAEDDNICTVTVVNATPEAGNVSIQYRDSDNNKVDTHSTSYSFEKGTKINIFFPDGLNDGYEIYAWANYDNGTIAVSTTTDNEGNSVYYTKDNFTKTLDKSYTFYVYAKTSTSYVVAFYNTYSTTNRSLIGFAFAEDGQTAENKYVTAPKQDGKDFDYWTDGTTKGLNNITADKEVYPVYKANIFTVFRDYYAYFLKGLGVTLLLSVIAVFLALFLGMSICFIRLSNIHLIKFIAAAYVEIIRGVPLLLQLLVIYIILGPTNIHIGTFFTTEVLSCLIALFINSGAYTSEIFRSGIQAVDKGQMEAGRALGMSKWKVMLKIVMPQGIKNSLPSIGNELIAMIKETSLAVSVDASIGELMSVRKQITASTYINLPPYIIVAIIYFIVTFSLSKLIGLLERRLASHER